MKLNFELVPDSCWYSNLRTHLKKAQWDKLRKSAYEKAEGRCYICKAKAYRLEAHERWSYDDIKKVQKLEDIIAVCHLCHSVIHIGRTQLVGDEDKAIKHFMKVNNCSVTLLKELLGEVPIV